MGERRFYTLLRTSRKLSAKFFPHLYSRFCCGSSPGELTRFFCSFCDFRDLSEDIVHFLDIRKSALPDSISCFYNSFSNGIKKHVFVELVNKVISSLINSSKPVPFLYEVL